MAENTEKTVQKTYRLPAGLVDYIEDLVKLQVLGSNGSAVVRTLLSNAVRDLDNNETVKKHLEARKLLREQ